MGSQVAAVATPWAKAYDHSAVCVNMDRILRALGVTQEHVRRRLTAHAIVASGWRQNVHAFNVWKVKIGGWSGDYYIGDTVEENKAGATYTEHGTKWRAYSSFDAALADHPVFTMKRYAAAEVALLDPSRPDADYWIELGKAGYYTDTHQIHGDDFASICRRVAHELGAAPPDEKKN
jgi:hypothetical protein